MGKKRVLITGANKERGIGIETARLFLSAGYEVIVIGRNFKDFPLSGEKDVTTVTYDLENIQGIGDLVKQIGPVDVLVNNAGLNNFTHYTDYTPELKERISRVNLEAPIELIKGVLKDFEKKGTGRIVNVASNAGIKGNRDLWYGITKAGLINVTKSFANLVGEKGIVINAVAPGVVDTQWLEHSPYQDLYAKAKEKAYGHRHASPKEVAQVIFWLSTDSPEYINGETIPITGGQDR